jgi:flagellar basal-body rod modification protein FlgD
MSQISAFSPVDDALRTAGSNRFSELRSEDFIKIIFTELANQDPLEPSDSSALLDQLNSIRSIESDIHLQQELQNLVRENQLASAGNLIGRFVGGLTESATRVSGYVASVQRSGENVNLELDNGWIVPFDQVELILERDPLESGESAA